jgi:putative nucleotidyltransferase with HDIG domain
MHADRAGNLSARLFRLTWEDWTLAAVTSAWVVAPKAMPFFHLYTIAAMVLTLSLGSTRGLWVALSRAGGACVVILLGAVYGPMRHLMGLEVLSMAGCGLFAGLLGERQRRAREELKRSFLDTLQVLARALSARDPYTQGHTLRTARYAVAIAREMKADAAALAAIEQAGLLHDLGKIGTPDAVLRKEGPLTAPEQNEMRRHPIIGGKILEGVAFLADAADLVRHHHEHYDGSGYPEGLSGADIPLGARILAVADALDAMTTDRPYHKAMVLSEAVREVERSAGKQFDPLVSDALKRVRL